MSIRNFILHLQRLTYRHFPAIAILAALGIVAVLFVGGRQSIAVGLIPSPWDKLVHAGVFALLACTIGWASNLRGWHKLAIAFFSALLVGALDELHQMYLPGREAGVDDFIADIIGSIFGTAFLGMKSSRPLHTPSRYRGVSSFALMRSRGQGNGDGSRSCRHTPHSILAPVKRYCRGNAARDPDVAIDRGAKPKW